MLSSGWPRLRQASAWRSNQCDEILPFRSFRPDEWPCTAPRPSPLATSLLPLFFLNEGLGENEVDAKWQDGRASGNQNVTIWTRFGKNCPVVPLIILFSHSESSGFQNYSHDNKEKHSSAEVQRGGEWIMMSAERMDFTLWGKWTHKQVD